MTDAMTVTVSRLIVRPVGGELEGDRATQVDLCDEGGGCFVSVTQHGDDGSMSVRIAPEEWPALRRAINRMMKIAEGEK